jgi:hypothetical protein
MKRRTSGQVLIGAATLMLVILLTMAASLPVINTSIDPSSEAMNVMTAISETLAKRVLLEIGAAQCANEMIGSYTYVIIKTADVAVGKARSAFVERLKKLYPGAGGIKDLNIEVLDSSIHIKLPEFGGPARIGSSGKVESYPLGDISVSIRIGFRVTYYVDKGKGNLVFKKFTYHERFFATTDTRYGGAGLYVHTNPVEDLSSAMPGWLDTAIGFIPVIGDIYTIASAPTYFRYEMAFNVGRAIEIRQYDASGNLVGSISKGEGATPRYDLTLKTVDGKVNDKLIITFFNRPDKSYKVILDKGIPLIGWLFPKITRDRKLVGLTEYYNIDWVTVALGVIGILPIGDLAKLAKVRQDLSRGNGLDNDNILSYKINDFYPKKPGYKIQPIKPIGKSGMDNQGRMYKKVEYNIDNLQLSYAAQKMLQQTKKEIEEIVPAGKSWIDELIEGIIRFIGAFFGSSSDLGRQADEGGILNSMVQQELLQNLGSRSDMKLFSDQDPFMWVLYPRPGGGAYSACVWLENFYPIIETK